jgi:hypothetical protein
VGRSYALQMFAKGTFEVDLHREPPFDTTDGVALSRASLDKRFAGALQGTSKGQMLAAFTPTQGSASYVAIERIEGTLDGKRGTFVAAHIGVMTRGTPSLTIHIVPDSGTGELGGIAGKMSIQIVDGRHFYEMEYTLPA